MSLKPLWTCPSCGERFISPRLWHSCGRHTYDALFAKSEPHVRAIFERLARAARACGPVRIYPQKTRVVMQVRIRFAGGRPQRSRFIAGFIVPRTASVPRTAKVEEYGSRHYIGIYVPLARVRDVNREILRLMRLAYKIGCQEHLK
jgi:hypothetical protein